MKGSAALTAYRWGTRCLTPAAPLVLRWRLRRGKEDAGRVGERRGVPGHARPPGDLVWTHGASIGETLALMPVVEALTGRGQKVLVTSGTRTSAEVLARRLPAGARHQFVPLDMPAYAARFLDHWRPQAAIFAESDIWPNLIVELARRRVPLILVNGRISERSFAGWQRAPKLARALFGSFALCLGQSAQDAERLARLGAPVGGVAGNLKFDIAPPPADPVAVERQAAALAGRTVWMAASTHPGEEEAILDAHAALARRFGRLLTLVAPRHPERGPAIADAADARGLAGSRRSSGATIGPDDDVHLVDTIGELGLFFRLTPLVFMGGSLVPHGGQNPIEPARLGAAILHGPHTGNFEEIYAALDARGGALQVADGAALAAAAADLLADARLMRDMARAAAATVAEYAGALERTMQAMETFLPAAGPPEAALW